LNNKFATIVNAYMLKMDMRPVDFKRTLGLSENDYMNYCYGVLPRTRRAIRIAKVVGCSVEELF
jgi:hypothetical protein